MPIQRVHIAFPDPIYRDLDELGQLWGGLNVQNAVKHLVALHLPEELKRAREAARENNAQK